MWMLTMFKHPCQHILPPTIPATQLHFPAAPCRIHKPVMEFPHNTLRTIVQTQLKHGGKDKHQTKAAYDDMRPEK